MKIPSCLGAGRTLVLSAALLGQTVARAADTIADHQEPQTTPISLGTSGGNVNDISSLYCCSGTLGALVTDGTDQYILSNNHVLGKANLGNSGDDISQPGLIDNGCAPGKTVADLTAFVQLKFKSGKTIPKNQVDAAIAKVVPGAVSIDGDIIGIGGVSGDIYDSVPVGTAVRKSGRTTGLTYGTVSATGVTVDVGYSDSCGGPSKYVARFENQIFISDGSFSAGGDSGSLIVESAVGTDGLPRAVGLLFAGSSSSTIANPIAAVLNQLGSKITKSLTMVKGTAVSTTVGDVTGTVKNLSGGPISGATIASQTGQSTTSGTDGVYTLSKVPAGSATITASAAGYASQSDTVTVVASDAVTHDFQLSPATVATKALVKCVNYQLAGARNRNLQITIKIVDDLGAPINGATVSISVKLGTNPYGTGSGTTTSAGQVTFTVSNAPNGVYETTVTAIGNTDLDFVSGTPINSFDKGSGQTSAQFCSSTAGSSVSVSEAVAGKGRAGIEQVQAIKERHSDELFNVADVVGHGVGQNADGEPVIEVYLAKENANSRRVIPAALEDVPVRIIVTGEFQAY